MALGSRQPNVWGKVCQAPNSVSSGDDIPDFTPPRHLDFPFFLFPPFSSLESRCYGLIQGVPPCNPGPRKTMEKSLMPPSMVDLLIGRVNAYPPTMFSAAEANATHHRCAEGINPPNIAPPKYNPPPGGPFRATKYNTRGCCIWGGFTNFDLTPCFFYMKKYEV